MHIAKLHAKLYTDMSLSGVMLTPLRDGSSLRGSASQSSLTTEKLRTYKQYDNEQDKQAGAVVFD
ncbi:MAG: hypothetical protein FWC25_02410 [Dehalococcoidia bacterium]|nr:hypothetical protein [Dehalococcoidia bacterium]